MGALRINGRRLETERAAGADQRVEEWPINGPGEGQFPRWRRGANIWREVTNPWNGSKRPRNRTVNEKGIAMKRCAQCHGPLGLGVRSRNVWNGRWWVHVRYCSTHCEALHELERYKARSPARREGLGGLKIRTSPAVSRLNYQTGRLENKCCLTKAHAITRDRPYERCGIPTRP